jgi:hypothetical protein
MDESAIHRRNSKRFLEMTADGFGNTTAGNTKRTSTCGVRQRSLSFGGVVASIRFGTFCGVPCSRLA